jgi:hypothetical protein
MQHKRDNSSGNRFFLGGQKKDKEDSIGRVQVIDDLSGSGYQSGANLTLYQSDLSVDIDDKSAESKGNASILGIKVYKRPVNGGKDALTFDGLNINVSNNVSQSVSNKLKVRIVQAMVRENLVKMKLIKEEEKKDEDNE